MTENVISKAEVTIYRLCHHDFAGISTYQAAKIMNMSIRRVEQLLASLKQKAPQLFPVLTLLQAQDYHKYTIDGQTMGEIARDTGRDPRTVSASIAAAVNKGMPKPPKKGRVQRYEPNLDGSIKEKF